MYFFFIHAPAYIPQGSRPGRQYLLGQQRHFFSTNTLKTLYEYKTFFYKVVRSTLYKTHSSISNELHYIFGIFWI